MKNEIAMYILAIVVIVGFFALLGFLLYHPIPKDTSEVIFTLFGALASAFGTVVGYFFGSSKSSFDKTELIVRNNPQMK